MIDHRYRPYPFGNPSANKSSKVNSTHPTGHLTISSMTADNLSQTGNSHSHSINTLPVKAATTNAVESNGTTSFTQIPILSLASARDPASKPDFLAKLLDALLRVGFLYLSDTGVSPSLIDQVCAQTRLFFDENVLPLAEKERIEMKNEKSFLGWSRVS
jgi:non-haem dioxygenase in morphine synthesis N-terminal